MLESYLVEQNLHWMGRHYPTGVRRELLDDVIKLLDMDHILAISGVRRCGKSFLMKQIINRLLDQSVAPENILMVNFDFPAFAGRPAEEILDTITREYRRIKQPQGKLYLFFDEIQTLPKWEIWLKYQYDLHKGSMKFFLTGSNSALLSSDYAARLTGRLIEKQLFPFSFAEFLVFHGIDPRSPEELILNAETILNRFEHYLNYGAMPEVVEQAENRLKTDLLSTYFNTIIYKDIAGRFGVRDTMLLKDVALYLLGQFTNPINLKKLAEQFSISRDTGRDLIKFLEMSYFIFSLSKFSYSHRTQLLSQKKTFAVDNGFSALLPVRFTPDRGRLLEQVVYLELKRRHAQIFYYKNQRECDFLIYDYGREAAAFQVCHDLNENNQQREIQGLAVGCRELKIEHGTILTWNQEDELERNGIHISVIPVWKWLLTNRSETYQPTN
jgi:hypothetical protein